MTQKKKMIYPFSTQRILSLEPEKAEIRGYIWIIFFIDIGAHLGQVSQNNWKYKLVGEGEKDSKPGLFWKVSVKSKQFDFFLILFAHFHYSAAINFQKQVFLKRDPSIYESVPVLEFLQCWENRYYY